MRLQYQIFSWSILFLVNLLTALVWTDRENYWIDTAQSVYHLREIAAGRTLYQDSFNHHFLGFLFPLYLIDTLLIRLTPSGVFVISVLCHFINIIAIYKILKTLSNKQTAWIGGLLTATLGWFPVFGHPLFNVQSSLLLVLSLLLWLYFSFLKTQKYSTLLLASFVCGVGLSFDQRMIVFSIFILLPFFFFRGLRKGIKFLQVCSTFMIAPGIGIAYLIHKGSLSEFFFQTVLFPLYYRNHKLHDSALSPLVDSLHTLLSISSYVIIPSLLSFLLLAFTEKQRPIAISFFFLLLSSFSYCLLGGRAYFNYYLLLAPFMLLTVSLSAYYFPTIVHRNPWRFLPSTLLLTVIASYICWNGITLLNIKTAKKELAHEVGDYLRNHIPKDSKVFVWGYYPQIYIYSNRLSPFPDVGLLSFAGANFESYKREDQGIVPEMENEFHRFLKETPPEVFIYSFVENQGPGYQRNLDINRAPHLSFLREMLAQDYRLEKDFSKPPRRILLYLQKKELP